MVKSTGWVLEGYPEAGYLQQCMGLRVREHLDLMYGSVCDVWNASKCKYGIKRIKPHYIV